MTERRETDRKPGKDPTPRTSAPDTPAPDAPAPDTDWSQGERIAKYLARAGVASRREIETLIADRRVVVDGETLSSPAFKVTGAERIVVDGRLVKPPQPTRLWRYHKPSGLVTTNFDPEGRATVFESLPKNLPRVVTVGRLDLTTEGLLLLTNDGELARQLELPNTGLRRVYRARAHGRPDPAQLQRLRDGITVEGEKFGSIDAVLERQTGANCWLRVELAEGRKREVRRALEAIELVVNRLIRISYGPFQLGDLTPGQVEEIRTDVWRAELDVLLGDAPKPTVRKRMAAQKGWAKAKPRARTKSRKSTPPG